MWFQKAELYIIVNMDTTIAAISTAYGESGIGIVRMSGPEAFDIAKKIFVPAIELKKPF